MTPESQRIAIAEACPNVCHVNTALRQAFWDTGSGRMGEFDPLNDLNAMHEAEKVLTEQQQYDFAEILGRLGSNELGGRIWRMVHATAAQRAEAFLRTLGKWTDDAKA